MGGKTEVPQPSPSEVALQQAQADLLGQQRQIIEEQRQQQKILLPFLAEQEGFDIEMDERGNIKSIKKKDDPEAAKRKELEGMYLDRSLKAMKGELPLDPALEDSLKSSEQQMREKLQSQFGPGYETSSPAIETLSQFMKTSEILREGARTGQLTLSEQLGLTREQQEQFSRGSATDALRNTAIGDPMTFAGAFGQTARGYGQAQVPFLQQRQMQAQASSANSDRLYKLLGAGIGAGGQIGAAYFSDPELKSDLVHISDTLDGIPIYEYTRKDTGERMLGVLSSDVEAKMPWAVLTKGGYDVVDYERV
jgi:hypothetical protein